MRKYEKGSPKKENRGREIFYSGVQRAVKNFLHSAAISATVGVGVTATYLVTKYGLDALIGDLVVLVQSAPALLLKDPLPLQLKLEYRSLGKELLALSSGTFALTFALTTFLFRHIGNEANKEYITRGRIVLTTSELNKVIEKWVLKWIILYGKNNPEAKLNFHQSFDLGEAFEEEKRQMLFGRYFEIGSGKQTVYIPEIIQYQHIGIGGSTGTGKSVLFESLLRQAQEDPETIALVVDYGGLYYEKFGRPQDRILSSFDKRAAFWDFWSEPILTAKLAEALIEESSSSENDFFTMASRNLFIDLLARNSSLQGLWADITSPFELIKEKLVGSISLSNFSSDNQAAGVLTSMQNYLSSMKYLNHWNPQGSPFSIVNWVANSLDGWTYIVVGEEEKPLLKPWMRLWTDLAIAGALRRAVKQKHKRLIIFADELPALGYLPSLPLAITNGRKFGISCVMGWQSVHQIIDVFNKQASSILSCTRTRFDFNPEDEKSAEAAAKHCGRIESYELNESDQFSEKGNQSESQSYSEKNKYLIDPTEFTSLDKHECILKMPVFDPVKLLILPENIRSRNAPYNPQTPPGSKLLEEFV